MPYRHLNPNLLEKILRKKENVNVKIKDFKISEGSRKGDNFSSDICRIHVEYEAEGTSKYCSIISKCIIDSDEVCEIIKDYNIVGKEIEMYLKILPKMTELSGTKFGPECYYITGDNAIFFLEDLKEAGYVVADPTLGLDFNHSKVLIEKLAQFHGTSMVIAENEPEIFANFREGMFAENKPFTFSMFESSFSLLLDVIREWEGFGDIPHKIEKLSLNMTDKISKCFSQDAEFKVLNHGDCWINNFLFKYSKDTNQPSDVLFVTIHCI